MSIIQDNKGFLWIGTDNGLNMYNEDSKLFNPYKEEDGLPNDVIHGILEDKSGLLWLSTENGLSKFNPEPEIFKNYGYNELHNLTFYEGTYFKNQYGEIFFGGMHGLNAFDPEKIKENLLAPQMQITDLKIFNNSVPIGLYIDERIILGKDISETEEINLLFSDTVFSFEFTALDFTNPIKNQYAYKMEGFDKEWNYIGTRRIATYTNLPAGNYVFRVKGSNNNGVWNEEGYSIRINMTPPPWQTWLAYTLYVITLVLIIFIFVRYRLKLLVSRIKQQNNELKQERLVTERLKKVDRLKDDFLANVSHELRTPLHGIIGITQSLIDGVAGKPTETMWDNFSIIISSGKRLASLFNSLLDFSKLKKHDLRLKIMPVDIRILTNIVLKISSSLVYGKKLVLTNNIRDDVQPVDGDENRLEQIMYNLIGNAIKFIESGSVVVSAKVNKDLSKVYISVPDTVNLASRLEGLTKLYGVSILISEYTLNKIGNIKEHDVRFLGKVQVKRKLKPVSVFEIFDEDPGDVKRLKQKTLKIFEQGLKNYFNRNFTKAALIFKQILKFNPKDKSAHLYLKLSALFMVKGVSDKWSGIEIMNHK